MTRTALAVLCLGVLASSQGAAQVEGVAEMKMTMGSGGSGTGRTYVSPAGARSEIQMRIPVLPQPVKLVWLMKATSKDVAYMINDEKRTWVEIDLKETRDSETSSKDDATYEIHKLGKESLVGYPVITSSSRVRRGERPSSGWLATSSAARRSSGTSRATGRRQACSRRSGTPASTGCR